MKTSLNTQNFISKMSLQETTRVLTKVALLVLGSILRLVEGFERKRCSRRDDIHWYKIQKISATFKETYSNSFGKQNDNLF
jgi:hypothetical protein